MKLGVIGIGVVGEANVFGFKKIGQQVKVHDLKLNTKLLDLLDTEIIFLCLPTPSDKKGDCDTSIISDVTKKLSKLNYRGIICIRSTVHPGYSRSLLKKYKKLKICYSPEFLRERMAKKDFTVNHNVLAVGTNSKIIFNKIVKAHGKLPKKKIMMKLEEAELLKYFNNVYASTRIIFANIIYEISKKFKCDYNKIKSSYIHTGKALDLYLDVNKNLRGYGGPCLPKDTKALRNLLKKLHLDFKLIDSIDKDNNKLKTTVFKGMRKI